MSDSKNPGGSGRREFLKKTMRTVLFGGFVLTGLHLARRSESAAGGSSACPPAEACGRCVRLRNCGDSRAVRYKSASAEPGKRDEGRLKKDKDD
jgi:hypothetical protein